MIDHTLDRERAVLHVRPTSALTLADFEQLARAVDPYIEEAGALAGLLVEAPRFPGWDDFAALAAHLRFVRDHHRHVRRIALVTDSPLGRAAERLASHFVSAEIRRFPASALDAARAWVAPPP